MKNCAKHSPRKQATGRMEKKPIEPLKFATVWEIMQKMRCNYWQPLNPDHANYLQMVNMIKNIIDMEEDIANGYCLEFNTEFTAYRKREVSFNQNQS